MGRLDDIFAGFRSSDHDVQREADYALGELTDAGPLTTDEAIQALRLAAESLPPRQHEWEDSASDLVLAAVTAASEELVPVVEDVYVDLPTPFARTAALRILANVGTRESVASLALLLSRPPDPRDNLDGIWWDAEPRHADLVLPALLNHLDDEEKRASVFEVTLRLATTEPIGAEHAAKLVPAALRELRRLRPNAPETFDWNARNLDSALDRRRRAVGALTLLAHTPPTDQTVEQLELWLDREPVVAGAAVASLTRLGADMDPAAIGRVADDPEARRALFSSLVALDRLDLMPSRQRSQEALAEAQLVEWLTYPAELGRPPDEIELAEVVSAETPSGIADLYVFRVRARGRHYTGPEWFAGVAGPYLRAESPTTEGGWLTFSAFEPWEDRSPLDHAELVAEIIESWRTDEWGSGPSGGV
jgi:hypothetical protein